MTTIPPRTSSGAAPTTPTTPAAELFETHSGVVLLMGDSAYKLKKPVDLGFLDFSTLEQRERACRREVVLNRRIAPDVYLGVGQLRGADGAVVEHLVMMRRMPGERRLSHLLRTDGVAGHVREIARTLAVFHASGTPMTTAGSTVTSESLRALWETSFVTMRQYAETLVPAPVEAAVEGQVERYLRGRRDLFERRRRTGSVVDGHGDLTAEDVFCLDDGPRLLDCLDFDDRLRVVDQVDDAAFLAMDLERLGAPDLATRFLAWYAEFSGDEAPDSLVHHYIAYRAFVRAKVAALRFSQGHAASAVQARRLLRLTADHLDRGAVKLVVVGGPPGTGKSTLAGALADRTGATVLSTDRVRKELAGLSPAMSAASGWQEGIYSEAWTERVDEEVLRRAELLLEQGESVVLDSTWSRQWRREQVRRQAQSSYADLVEIECRAPDELADERLRERELVPAMSVAGTRSDAGLDIARRVRASFDPWRTAHVVDTSAQLQESVDRAMALVRPASRLLPPVQGSLIEPD